MVRLLLLGAALLVAGAAAAPSTTTSTSSLDSNDGDDGTSRRILQHFLRIPSNYSLAEHLLTITAEPHLAGTLGDFHTAEFVASKFEEFGLDAVSIPSYSLYLSFPTDHRSLTATVPGTDFVFNASLAEPAVPSDPYSQNPRVTPTYNGYSPSGNVAGEVVYANYGREEDFALLAARGVSLNGSIALVRYSKNYRGAKVRNAHAAGCVACLIYSDPKDYDPHGSKFPDGDGLPLGGVQRGSVVAGAGDPVTPGWPAERVDLGIKAETIDTDDPRTGLPKIPVQPISAADALPLLLHIEGEPAPKDWVGGLDAGVYKVGRGPVVAHLDLVVENRQAAVWNVIGLVEGSVEPDRYVVLGNHRDAWVYGAVDPNSGTAALLEIGRALGQMVRAGWRPRRSIVLASWDAEEACLGGSTEWGEEHELLLMQRAVAYLNVDSAVAGVGFWASATPSLDGVVLEASKLVPDPDARRKGASLYDTWSRELGRLGDDGSDHGVFVQRLGIPSTMLGFNAGDYPVYHSVSDDFMWMSEQGDPGFHRHVAVTQVWGAVALTLAEARDLPLNYADYAAVLRGYVHDVRRRLAKAGGTAEVGLAPMVDAVARFEAAALQVERERRRFVLDEGGAGDEGESEKKEEPVIALPARRLRRVDQEGRRAPNNNNSSSSNSSSNNKPPFASAVARFVALREFNDRLMLAERGFLDFEGLQGPGEAPYRAWLRHMVYSPPQGNEYGSTAFANVVDAIELVSEGGADWANVQHQVWRAGRALDRAAMVLRGRRLL